ncbi:S8 family serine peptidase [Chryseobacterium sp. MFBS3-17]|uniref:S8 family serine peptidase n=1 Tax=Chryseobacterium sp. MFBS3-17 TaxID=2886689 RepID=UPI001D0E90BA|nr:S8 family serine peptidase [Chryseobacterium sp. MFBS3-17]MCC2589440.1 S8 family serine peptidase [Chryseobacterium sp. MFBS3-17]
MKNKHLLIALLALPGLAMAQTDEEKIKIASHSNKEANAKLAIELRQEEDQRIARLNAFLAANPNVNPVIKDDESGKVELMDVLPNGEFVYAKTYNDGSATTARAKALYNGGSLGINIQGQGMTVGVWDGGSVRDTHQEFMVNGVSKIQNMDSSSPFHYHATHVTGTIAAQGLNTPARGLAFNSSIKAYDWSGDINEMNTEAGNGLLLSNHSYGIGSLGSIWFYGAYDSRARNMDVITYNNPYYLPVVSAGNDRNETSPPGSTQLSNKFGYDMIFGHGNAKNVVTVGAVNQVNNYTGPTSVTMSSFSSWGPSDDGRIKPDITTKGVAVYSTLETADNVYASMPGTSMASPGITGVLTLLQQYHNQLYGSFMRAATTKGLLLHTADEAGYNPGPDYEYGWGLVNATRAAEVIRDKNLSANGSIIEETTLAAGATYTKNIIASGTTPLQVSISWTDPAPAASLVNSGTVDPTTNYLVNDLDVKVTAANGTIYYPWKLDGMANFGFFNPATRNSANNVDNFERVDIENPSGQYTITVTHKGTLTNGPQHFTLIASSDGLSQLSVRDVSPKQNLLDIYPNPATDFVNVKNGVDGSRVSVLDMAGRIIKQHTLKEGRIDVSGLETGNYLLIYKGKDDVDASFKFTKK